MSPQLPSRLLDGVLIVASVAFSVAWAIISLIHHPKGSLAHWSSVSQLDGLQKPWWMWAIAGLAAAITAALLARRPQLASNTTAAGAVLLMLVVPLFTAIDPLLHFTAITTLGAIAALSIGLHFGASRESAENPARDRIIGAGLWLLVAAVMSTFALHRYWSFGAGSWDLGCMIHNFYRASRFLNTTSTVLGDVDFLGDHFMAGIYLYAPIFWVSPHGGTLLVLQSINLAATSPAIYGIARIHGATRLEAAALALAAGLSFGLQSAAYFDSHEITVGFGFLAFGLWAIEAGRLRLATVLLAIFILFKESLGAYLIALGLLLLYRALLRRDRRFAIYGAAWILGGAIWFVLVNRVFMPALIARANPPEAHETFADFGPTVFAAMKGVLSNPLKALGAIFVPDEKIESQLVTLGGVGWLAIAAPEILIPALPLLAERFLSSKNTMWEMGYHYAAPLCLYAAWAAAIGWPRIRHAASVVLEKMGAPGPLSAPVLSLYLVAMAALINGAGYRHPANFYRWNMDYFSTPERQASNKKAVAFLRELDRDEKLAVQNRILPHLADRAFIYRIGDWAKADYVLLSIGENAWPWDDGFPRRLASDLARNRDWKLIFHDRDALIFARATKSDAPPIPGPEWLPTSGR